jgi:membrane protease YdiL (CAAX protease family)
MLAAFLLFLRRRGWRPADFRVRLGGYTSLRGLELLVFTYGGFLALAELSHFILWLLAATPYEAVARLFVPTHVPIPPAGVHLGWVVLSVSTVLNAFFEELVYMGYAFNLWAARYGARAAVLFTIFARLAVHTYQGTEHVLAIAVWAVLFGLWYRYHREVWPLILAHAAIDLISFGLIKVMHGGH